MCLSYLCRHNRFSCRRIFCRNSHRIFLPIWNNEQCHAIVILDSMLERVQAAGVSKGTGKNPVVGVWGSEIPLGPKSCVH